MERKQEKTTVIKPKQFGTILLLISSIFFIVLSCGIAGKFINDYFRLQALEKREKELLEKIATLDELYDNLQDDDFYTLYILEYYNN